MFTKHRQAQPAKTWQHLTDESIHSFDQTNGVLSGLDRVEPEDPRPAQRAAEGAAISGMLGKGM